MAAAYRTSAAGGSTSGTTNRTVAITAALDDLLVVCGAFGVNTNVAPTCTDDKGGTYTLVSAGLHNASGDMHCMFVRNGPCGYASSHTITVATGSNTAGEVVAVAISGMARFGPDAVRQFQLVQNQAGSSNPAASFTANCLTTNVTIGMVANATNPATLTAPTGWTERQDVGQATPNVGLEVVTRDSGFTTQNVGWGSATTLFGVIIVELDGGAAPTFPGSAVAIQRLFNVAPTTGTETTSTVTTEAAGSTILLGAARGTWANGTPTDPFDNKSNTYGAALASGPHSYTGFAASKTEVIACTAAVGGSGHTASLGWGAGTAGSGDEVTVNLVEVDNVNKVQSSSWVDQPNLVNTSASNNVTTTGPAILIAYFWGYGNTGQLHVFRPQTAGFYRLAAACTDGDPVGAAGYIQCTVLWKQVSAAGTYNCVASGTAQEGAQIYLVALQQTITGAFAVPIDDVTIGATGTVGGGGISGALAVTLADVTAAAAGTVKVGAALSKVLDDASLAAAAAVKIAAALATSLADVSLSAAGRVQVVGSLSSTLDAATIAAAGTAVHPSAALSQTLADVAVVGVGKVQVAAALAKTLDDAAIASTGVAAVPTGSLSATLADVAISSAGKVQVAGATSQALADAAIAAAGTVKVEGAANITLDATTIAASGGAPTTTGSLSVTLADAAISAAGAVAIAGATSQVLADVGISATGTITTAIGSLSKILDDVTAASAGAVQVIGTLSKALDAATVASTGDASQPTASANIALEDAIVAAAGAVQVAADLVKQLDDATSSAAGSVVVAAALTTSLADVTVSSTGLTAGARAGDLNTQLDDAVAAAAATVQVSATLTKTIGDVIVSAAAQVGIAGALAKQLDDAVTAAQGKVVVAGVLAGTLDNVTILSTATVADSAPPNAGDTGGGASINLRRPIVPRRGENVRVESEVVTVYSVDMEYSMLTVETSFEVLEVAS